MGNAVTQGLSLQFQQQLGDSFRLNAKLELPASGITVLFGKSGSGKTTLLRLIAGLNRADSGKITLDGQTWQNDTLFLPVHQRPLAYVFQEASLLPHLGVRGNLLYAIRRADRTRSGMSLDEAVDLFDIKHLLDKSPQQLSGGESQRVAMARAVLSRPRLLLMDEPLSALDEAARQRLLPLIERLRHEHDLLIVYVTHSVAELARLADHLVIMSQGEVQASGTFTELIGSGVTVPGLEELGSVIDVRVESIDSQWSLARLSFGGGHFLAPRGELETGALARLRILPDDVSLTLNEQRDSSILNRHEGTLDSLETVGTDSAAAVLVSVRLGEILLKGRVTRLSADSLQLRPRMRVWVQIKSMAILK